jgi:predicted GNAT family acetyltransferase
MNIVLTREIERVDGAATEFLAERVERNVLATLLAQFRAGGRSHPQRLFGWGKDDSGKLRFFAMRTPPWPLLVSEVGPREADALIARWLLEDPRLPGVTGVPAATRALAAAWQARTHGHWRRRLSEALHVLEEVIDPPRWPSGRLRPAHEGDRELLGAWERDFQVEASASPGAAIEAQSIVDRRIARREQFVWDDGAPVSTLGLNIPIAATVRIGPVFTPREHRCRGYASAAVASASRQALTDGARRCMLFTDLENPTSNKIYAAVGFRRHCDWEELEFLAAADT